MNTTLEFSYYILAAGLGGAGSGFCHVIARAWNEGGGIRTIRLALRRRSRFLAAILVVDAIGGLVVAFTGYASGASEPIRLIDFVNSHPITGWALVGFVGPLVSGRLFTGGFVRGRYNQWVEQRANDSASVRRTPDVADQAWRLRAEAVTTIEDAVWAISQYNFGIGAEFRRRAMIRKLTSRTGLVHAHELVRLTEQYFSRPGRTMSEKVQKTFRACEQPFDSDDSTMTAALSLGHALISGGFWDPVDAFIGPRAFAAP